MGPAEVLILLSLAILGTIAVARPEWFHRLGDRGRALWNATPASPWVMAVTGSVVLSGLLLILFEEDALPVVVLIGLLLFAAAWFREFQFLMKLGDDAFPGRYDKPIWALLLIVLPPVGVPTFWTYRRAHWPEAEKGRAGVESELA